MIQRRMLKGFSARYFQSAEPRKRGRGVVLLPRRELVCTIAQFTTCQWLDGNAPSKHSAMCGQPTLSGKPYCGGHWARAWRPAEVPGVAAEAL